MIPAAPWALALLVACPPPGDDDTAPPDDTGGHLDTGDACTDVEDAVPYGFDPDVILGTDDLGSPGAALMVAVDEAAGAGLVVALRFDLPFYSGDFVPGCSVGATAADYAWGAGNEALAPAAKAWPWLAAALTDTAGIRGLDTAGGDTAVAAFLLLHDKDATRVFVAAQGLLTLTRLDGKEEIVEGNLAFAEVSEAGPAAAEVAGGDHLRLDDVFFRYPYHP
jgi:hypothetical protein